MIQHIEKLIPEYKKTQDNMTKISVLAQMKNEIELLAKVIARKV